MKNITLISIVALLIVVSGCMPGLNRNTGKDNVMMHAVYFELNDNSPQLTQKLVDDCNKYLSNHPGIKYFSVGTRATEYDRSVNVKDWDVALHVVFESKEAHDKYQVADDHHKFIDENKQNWKSVKVFDSLDAE